MAGIGLAVSCSLPGRVLTALRPAAESALNSCRAAANPTFGRYRWHQQYLSDAKNPYGHCPDHGTDVSCPIGVVSADG